MSYKQPSLWAEEELDAIAPKRKSKKALQKEKRENFKRRLLERAVLSYEEIRRYSLPITKSHLINSIQKSYENWTEQFNPGIPKMLLTTLSQFSRKAERELLISDLIVLYKSIKKIFPDHVINDLQLKEFRKENKLSFFGAKQFYFIEKYLGSINN